MFSNQELPHKTHRMHFIMQRNIIEIKALFHIFIERKVQFRNIPSYLEKHYRFVRRKDRYPENKKLRNFNFLNFLKHLHNYLIIRISSSFDKQEAHKKMTQWLNNVEKTNANTIEQSWLKSIGSTLLEELDENLC